MTVVFLSGDEARTGDVVRVQKGKDAGKEGVVQLRQGSSLIVAAHAGASWSSCTVDVADVAVVRAQGVRQ